MLMLSTSRRLLSVLPVLVASPGLLVACADFPRDPLHDKEVAALGPEDPAVPIGALHRPGQPCAACHRPDGVAGPYTAAGTVYRDPIATMAVADVTVVLIDSAGKTFTTTTNCVGNFYVRPTEFQPKPPMWVSVQIAAIPFPFKMESPIHREASCAVCHFDPEGPNSAGHLFVADDATTFADIPLRACEPADGVSR